MPDYIVERLCPAAIISAYPLVHLTVPGLGLTAWRRQAKSAMDGRFQGGRGILVARRKLRQHICGMVWYRCEYDLSKGKILAASNLIAIDILDPEGIIVPLLQALGLQARAQGCAGVKLSLPHAAGLFTILNHAISQLEPASSIADCRELSFPV